MDCVYRCHFTMRVTTYNVSRQIYRTGHQSEDPCFFEATRLHRPNVIHYMYNYLVITHNVDIWRGDGDRASMVLLVHHGTKEWPLQNHDFS